MGNFINNALKRLPQRASQIALVAATSIAAAPAAYADSIPSNVDMPDGGYSEFSNPSFVKCAVEGLSEKFSDNQLVVNRSKRQHSGAELTRIHVRPNKWLGNSFTLSAISGDSNGFIDRARTRGNFDGQVDALNLTHNGKIGFKYFNNVQAHTLPNAAEEFKAALNAIAECNTSNLPEIVSNYSVKVVAGEFSAPKRP